MKKTFCSTKEDGLSGRGWVVVDATDIALGRLSSGVAAILKGKNKVTYTPHVDCGDFVVVVNADRVKLTGSKRQSKIYYSHSEYPGGIKAIPASRQSGEKMVQLAVKGMLPRGPLGRRMLAKLKVYPDANHPHSAQGPTEIKLA